MSKVRKQKTARSGGIGVFVKSSISPFIQLVESDCEYVLWFEINSNLLDVDEDILVGSVYIPPDNSEFYSHDLYESFTTEVEQFSASYKYTILTGDFNARSGSLSDIIEIDLDLLHNIDVQVDDVIVNGISSILENNDMSHHRCSCDTVVNRAVSNLVDLCKSNDLVFPTG